MIQKVKSHRITLPVDLCRKYNIKEGDWIRVSEKDNSILVTKAE